VGLGAFSARFVFAQPDQLGSQTVLDGRLTLLVPAVLPNRAKAEEATKVAKFWNAARTDLAILVYGSPDDCRGRDSLNGLRKKWENEFGKIHANEQFNVTLNELTKLNNQDVFKLRYSFRNSVGITTESMVFGMPSQGKLILIEITCDRDMEAIHKAVLERIVASIVVNF
jgi:hypothetical protein